MAGWLSHLLCLPVLLTKRPQNNQPHHNRTHLIQASGVLPNLYGSQNPPDPSDVVSGEKRSATNVTSTPGLSPQSLLSSCIRRAVDRPITPAPNTHTRVLARAERLVEALKLLIVSAEWIWVTQHGKQTRNMWDDYVLSIGCHMSRLYNSGKGRYNAETRTLRLKRHTAETRKLRLQRHTDFRNAYSYTARGCLGSHCWLRVESTHYTEGQTAKKKPRHTTDLNRILFKSVVILTADLKNIRSLLLLVQQKRQTNSPVCSVHYVISFKFRGD